MASATEPRYDALVAAYAALAIVIHILEAGLPSPIPGIKPGLANVVTLLVLLRYGWALASWVVLIRVLASSLLLGTFMTPSFFLSAGGAICSVLALGLLCRWNAWGLPRFGPYGFGVLSACSHISAQFLLAYTLFIPHSGLLKLLPVLLLSSLIFGLFSAWLASNINRQMPPITQTQVTSP